MAWKDVSLGELISQRKEFIEIKPDETYMRCRVQTSARGIVLRDRVEGLTIKTKKQQVCRAGEFLVAEIDAKMGGYGVVPSELEGAIVSSHYFLYHVDETKLLRSFLDWYSKTPLFLEQVKARGSTNYAAIRPEAVLGYSIPLPSLEEQHAIVRRLDSAISGLQEVGLLFRAVEADSHALVHRLHDELSAPEKLEFGELVQLDERQVATEADEEFPQLGIRSFGNGLFFKEPVKGSETSYKKFNQAFEGALIVSQPKGWEGAIAVAGPDHDGWFLSPEYRTFRCNLDKLDPRYLSALIVTPWFQYELSRMTKGQGARRERLRPEMLLALKLRVPPLERQRKALAIIEDTRRVAMAMRSRMQDAEALIPAMLHEIFERQANAPEAVSATSAANVVQLPATQNTEIDTPFKEAVLVGAIVKAFHEDNDQPIGNFRLQKAVYFARRQMGESALDKEYLRKAAGPYNPAMRYSGGIKIATDKNWIKRATGKYGEGNALGDSAAEIEEWIERYQFAPATAWVRDRFKYKSNDLWEALATIDYAMLALGRDGIRPTAAAVLSYIAADDEWRPKIEKLRLTESSIKNVMVELEGLFKVVGGSG